MPNEEYMKQDSSPWSVCNRNSWNQSTFFDGTSLCTIARIDSGRVSKTTVQIKIHNEPNIIYLEPWVHIPRLISDRLVIFRTSSWGITMMERIQRKTKELDSYLNQDTNVTTTCASINIPRTISDIPIVIHARLITRTRTRWNGVADITTRLKTIASPFPVD